MGANCDELAFLAHNIHALKNGVTAQLKAPSSTSQSRYDWQYCFQGQHCCTAWMLPTSAIQRRGARSRARTPALHQRKDIARQKVLTRAQRDWKFSFVSPPQPQKRPAVTVSGATVITRPVIGTIKCAIAINPSRDG